MAGFIRQINQLRESMIEAERKSCIAKEMQALFDSGLTGRTFDVLLRPVRVTLEAIDLNGGVFVAAVAKMVFAFDAGDMPVFIGLDMAVDTFGETVGFGANAIVHGFVTLVQDVVHVIALYLLFRLYTFNALTMWFMDRGKRCFSYHSGSRQQRQHCQNEGELN